jgi:hypothetical protein
MLLDRAVRRCRPHAAMRHLLGVGSRALRSCQDRSGTPARMSRIQHAPHARGRVRHHAPPRPRRQGQRHHRHLAPIASRRPASSITGHADPGLDAAADEDRVQRAVAGIEAQVRVGETLSTQRLSTSGAHAGRAPSPRAPRPGDRQGGSAASCAVARWPASRTSRRAAVGSPARLRSAAPARRTAPGSAGSARRRPWPADRSARRSTSRPAAARRSRRLVGRAAPWACNPDWRSQTSVLGSAPSDHRQRRIPASRSGVCLVKITAPAPARE